MPAVARCPECAEREFGEWEWKGLEPAFGSRTARRRTFAADSTQPLGMVE